jgi:hypothetical protein
VALRCDRAADHRDRRFWQLKNRCRSGTNRPTSRWTIGISLAVLKTGMPLILLGAECDEIHRARKPAITIRFRVVEDNADAMRIFLVLVDYE